MSFILDALRKSENERQQQAGGEFSNVPSSSGESQSPKWLWILAFLLLINIAILLGILLGPSRDTVDQTPAEPAQPAPAATTPAPAGQAREAPPSFEQRVAKAREALPPATEPGPVADAVPPHNAASPPPVVREPAPPAGSGERLMTVDELRLAGALQLPELHLDIHVFAEDPAERFVFINMSKHREKSKLDEGPVVAEITPEGVVLEYQGRRFLLPRE